MIPKKIQQNAFELNCELIIDLNSMNLDSLEIKYGITPAILEEIKQDLFEYFKTTIFPKLKIIEQEFEIFKYDNIDGYGIEARLFTIDGTKTELTLHTEFNDYNKLKYRLIEVM